MIWKMSVISRMVSIVFIGFYTTACGQTVQNLSPFSPQSQNVQPAANVLLSWSREGGFAGFCDSMEITAAGEVTVKSCRSNPERKTAKLSKENLARLDRWRTAFGSIVISTKDSPGSDAMTVTLNLKGTGAAQPTQPEKEEILGWAQKIYTKSRL